MKFQILTWSEWTYLNEYDIQRQVLNARTTRYGGNRFSRLYRRGPQLMTSGAHPASRDLALTPVFTDGELPLD